MSYSTTSIVFLALISVVSGQKLMKLSSFNGNDAHNPLNVPAPYSIYVSANDDYHDDIYKNMFIVSKTESMSLYGLKTRKLNQNVGGLERYVINDAAYLTTSLSDDQLSKLHGVMYLSSPEQVANKNFLVFNVDSDQNLKFDRLGEIDLTILFLNTGSTLISEWSQNPNSLVYIYNGFPKDAVEPENSQIFSNPVVTDMFNQFFPNVEKFSISQDAFYMKTYKGAPNFRMAPGSADIAGTFTTAFTTTGFYMKPIDQQENGGIQVNIMKDPKYSGRTGCNIIGYSPYGGMVSFEVYEGRNRYGQPTVVTDFFTPWSTPHIGDNFVISSTIPRERAYYLQYFIIQDPLINSTTPSQTTVVTTPPTVITTPKTHETTTKSSEKTNGLAALVFMAALRFL
ncbi:unnamed protein product [Caenorhabditis brenneri]